jgi:hypothetical protein
MSCTVNRITRAITLIKRIKVDSSSVARCLLSFVCCPSSASPLNSPLSTFNLHRSHQNIRTTPSPLNSKLSTLIVPLTVVRFPSKLSTLIVDLRTSEHQNIRTRRPFSQLFSVLCTLYSRFRSPLNVNPSSLTVLLTHQRLVLFHGSKSFQ